jgi:hypothetical protein
LGRPQACPSHLHPVRDSCARALTAGSRRMGVRRVSRRVCGLRGQIPSLQTCTRVPGHLHRQWTALDLPFVCLNMSLFCGAARDGLGVKRRSHRNMVSGDAPNARTSTFRPMRRAQQLRQILRSERLCRRFAASTRCSASPKTVNVVHVRDQ